MQYTLSCIAKSAASRKHWFCYRSRQSGPNTTLPSRTEVFATQRSLRTWHQAPNNPTELRLGLLLWLWLRLAFWLLRTHAFRWDIDQALTASFRVFDQLDRHGSDSDGLSLA